jgi:poly(3-hydroxybutyrate) depolymerase
MRDKGERAGFIVLQPDSLPAWTGSLASAKQRKLSDVDFVLGLLVKMDRLLCFDRNRIFASGWSAGGGMATASCLCRGEREAQRF